MKIFLAAFIFIFISIGAIIVLYLWMRSFMDRKVVDKDLYWKLFKSTFIISAFTIGGGFVIISLLKAKFVDEYKWLDDKEALNLVAIAQSAPGIMAVNAAIIIGYKLARA